MSKQYIPAEAVVILAHGIARIARSRMEPTEHVMQFFAFDHLPAHLKEVSKPFGELATQIIATLPRNPERTVALRKLLEAKDAAVRALVAK